MNCADAEQLILPHLEDALAPDAASGFAAHLRDCPRCRRSLAEQRRLGEALKTEATRFAAPPDLARRIGAAIATESAPPAAARPLRRAGAAWRPLAMAASLLLAIVASSGLTAYVMRPATQAPLVEDLVDSHIRSLMAGHLTDVASSDQHTVKPWFHGRLDLAPPVEDLAAAGYPLIGGRLDYVDGHAVAALVYRHRAHPINLFVLPPATGSDGPRSLTRRGFNLVHWTEDGVSLWAVSDLDLAELKDFVRLYAAKTGG